MSVRVSRSNRIAQPASTGIRAPGLQKLTPSKGVPVWLLITGFFNDQGGWLDRDEWKD